MLLTLIYKKCNLYLRSEKQMDMTKILNIVVLHLLGIVLVVQP